MQTPNIELMKPFLILILCFAMPVGSFGREVTNALSSARLAAAAQECFAGARSKVADAIRARLKGGEIGPEDLDAILAVLGAESNMLRQAAFDGRLELAERQMEAVRTQAMDLLHDPANKAMAAKLDPQRWLDRIARQRAVGTILEGDLARLSRTLEELRRWANHLEPVAPPEEVANALKNRLADLLSEWQRPERPMGQGSEALERQTRGRPTQEAANDRGIAGAGPLELGAVTGSSQSVTLDDRTGVGAPVHTVIGVPPAVAAVVRLAETGVAPEQILTFVDRYPSPFGLNGGQILCLRGKVSSAVICRMLEHDGVFRSRSHE
ncbi:MAG: hypothetical protein ABSH34_24405 [Verrucomicrobiota bacterium]|jgi:hypothetical protein